MRSIMFLYGNEPRGFKPYASIRTGQAGDWRLNPNTNEPELLNGETENQDIILVPRTIIHTHPDKK